VSWKHVAPAASIAPGDYAMAELDAGFVAVFNVAGEFFAIDDVCTHDGGPLSDGPVDAASRTIACPRHGAKFDLATGAAVTMPATKPTVAHDVKIEGAHVLVRINAQ